MNDIQRQRLLDNWGEKAEAFQCYAEIKYYDPSSGWECYIYAISPQDENEMQCVIFGMFLETCAWTFDGLQSLYNSDGNSPIEDPEYRRIAMPELLKQLREKYEAWRS